MKILFYCFNGLFESEANYHIKEFRENPVILLINPCLLRETGSGPSQSVSWTVTQVLILRPTMLALWLTEETTTLLYKCTQISLVCPRGNIYNGWTVFVQYGTITGFDLHSVPQHHFHGNLRYACSVLTHTQRELSHLESSESSRLNKLSSDSYQ